MKRKILKEILILGVGVLFLRPALAIAPPQPIQPATAEQIIRALGPDAEGLTITEDKIPDMFALTASRLDEDKSRFTVEEPYKGGRWKGGKVTIEYARDLSYTMVSVYDKSGNRQRIYSVVSQPASAEPASTSSSGSGSSNGWAPISSAESTDSSSSNSNSSSEATSATPSHSRHKKSTTSASNSSSTPLITTVNTPPPGSVTTAAVVGFEWDDARGAYVQIHSDGAASVPTPTTNHATSSSASAPAATVAHPAAPTHSSGASTAAASASTTATSASPEVASTASPSDTSTPPPASHSKRHKHATPTDNSGATSEAVVASVPPAAATEAPTPLHPAPNAGGSNEWVPISQTQATTPTPPPSVHYVWNDKAGTYVPVTGSAATTTSTNADSTVSPSASSSDNAASAAAPPPPTSSKRKRHQNASSDNSSAAPATTSSNASNAPADNGSAPMTTAPSNNGSAAPATTNNSDSEFTLRSQPGGDVPSTEDLLASGPSGNSDSGKSSKAAASTSTSSKKQQAAAAPPLAVSPDVTAAAANLDNQSNATPDSSGADSWTPKKAAAKPVPVDLSPVKTQPVQVAMVPKQAAPDNSIESLMKIAQAGNTANPAAAADQWSPKGGETPTNSEAELNAQLAQARKDENKPVPVPVIKIRRDVNNPEQGVLPANSFEKFSGPRYGRHWEYERRLHLEKRAQAPVKDYDFFVDEVDRKKEIHNIYYYKHLAGQSVPKLLAVERHTNVTFLSNYDVDSEDKGKVSKYD